MKNACIGQPKSEPSKLATALVVIFAILFALVQGVPAKATENTMVWESGTSIPVVGGGDQIIALTFGNGQFMAIEASADEQGATATAFVSANGRQWTQKGTARVYIRDRYATSLAFGEVAGVPIWVISGGGALMSSINNGETWSAAVFDGSTFPTNPPVSQEPRGRGAHVAFGDGVFLLSLGNEHYASSTNGHDWIYAGSSDTSQDGSFGRLAFGNHLFVSPYLEVGNSCSKSVASLTNSSSQSDNFVCTPNQALGGYTLPSTAGGSTEGLVFGNGKFLAGAYDQNHWYDPLWVTSNNGQAWSVVPYGKHAQSLAFGAGFFVADNSDNTTTFSADGVSWSSAGSRPSGGQYDSLMAFGNGVFMALGGSSAQAVDVGYFGQPIAPSNPTGFSAVINDGRVDLTWAAAQDDGGLPLDYVVTSSIGSFGCTTVTTHCRINGLTNGTAYAFTVKARNSFASSSGVSVNATPVGPTRLAVWTQAGSISVAENSHILALHFGHGLFMAVDKYGVTYTSPDATTWTIRGTLSNGANLDRQDKTDLAFGLSGTPGLSDSGVSGTPTWVLTNRDGKRIWTSVDDGLTWVESVVAVEGSDEIKKLSYGDGRFLIGYNYNHYMTSTNGLDWHPAEDTSSTGQNNNTGAMVFGNHTFVIPIAGVNTVCTRSTSGSWNDSNYECSGDLRSPDSNNKYWSQLAFGNNLFVGPLSATDSSDFSLSTSSDQGVTWSRHASLEVRPRGIAFGGGYFVLALENGSALISSDGVTWFGSGQLNFGATGGDFLRQYEGALLAFGNGRFVALSGAQLEIAATGTLIDGPPQAEPSSTLPLSNTTSAPVVETSNPTPAPISTPTPTPAPISSQTPTPRPTTVAEIGLKVLSGAELAKALVLVATAPASTDSTKAPILSAAAGAAVAPVVSGLPPNASIQVGVAFAASGSINGASFRSAALKASAAKISKQAFIKIGAIKSSASGKVKVPAFKASGVGTYTIKLTTKAGKAYYLKVKVFAKKPKK